MFSPVIFSYRFFVQSFFVLCMLFVSACAEPPVVLRNLSSQESVAAVVALQRQGIAAERILTSSRGADIYSVRVAMSERARSLELIHELGLTKSDKGTLETLLTPRGLMPGGVEMSRLRVLRAMELRIENLISALPGVLDSRALLENVNTPEIGTSSRRKFSAAFKKDTQLALSLVVRVEEGSVSSADLMTSVRDLLGESFPRLAEDSVAIKVVEVELPKTADVASTLVRVPLGFRIPVEDKRILALNLLFFSSVFSFCGLLIGAYLSSRSWKKRFRENSRFSGRTELSGGSSRSVFLEAKVSGEADPKTQASLPSGD